MYAGPDSGSEHEQARDCSHQRGRSGSRRKLCFSDVTSSGCIGRPGCENATDLDETYLHAGKPTRDGLDERSVAPDEVLGDFKRKGLEPSINAQNGSEVMSKFNECSR